MLSRVSRIVRCAPSRQWFCTSGPQKPDQPDNNSTEKTADDKNPPKKDFVKRSIFKFQQDQPKDQNQKRQNSPPQDIKKDFQGQQKKPFKTFSNQNQATSYPKKEDNQGEQATRSNADKAGKIFTFKEANAQA